MNAVTPRAHAEDSAVALQYDLTEAVRKAFRLDEVLAAHFAAELTRALQERLGGQEIYIPAPDKRARDEAIRREFNGRNLAEVCKRYGVGKSRLYEIVGET